MYQGETPPPDSNSAGNAAGNATDAASSFSLESLTDPETLMTYGGKALILLAFLFIGWIIAVWLGRITQRMLEKAKVDLTLTRFAGKAIRWTILIFVGIACLGYFGFEMTSAAALIAAMGLAIGLAFQGSLSNLAAGMMLLIFRPFKVGDVVQIGGQKGKIYEIDILATSLDTPDNRRIIVPNGSIFGNTIENITYHATRRVDVPVGAAYDEDIDKTRAALETAAASVEGIIADPPPQIVLAELGASSVDWVVRVWCPTADFFPVRERTVRAVKMGLDKANITIPFPQMDVHLDQLPPANS